MSYDEFIDKIIRSKRSPDTSKEMWEKHFTYLDFFRCLEKFYDNNELVAIGGWFRTDVLKAFDTIPINPRKGKYLYCSEVIVKDGRENKGIVLRMLKKVLKENPDIEKVFWHKAKGKYKIKSYSIGGQNGFKENVGSTSLHAVTRN